MLFCPPHCRQVTKQVRVNSPKIFGRSSEATKRGISMRNKVPVGEIAVLVLVVVVIIALGTAGLLYMMGEIGEPI